MAWTLPYSHCSSLPSGGAAGSGSGVLSVVKEIIFVEASAGTMGFSVEAAARTTGFSVEAATGTTGVSVEAAAGTTGDSVEAAAGTTGVGVVFSFRWLA